MAGFSDYTENKVLDFIFNAGSFTIPGLYLGLFKSDAGLETNQIGSADEVNDSASSYARININTLGGFNGASAGAVSNAQDMEFPIAQADWGTITHTAILDAVSGGNVLAWGPLLNPRTIYNGDSVKVPAGALVATLS